LDISSLVISDTLQVFIF